MSEPLAERMRPRTLDDYVGQEHIVGEGGVLRKMIESGRISSFILWGPPGVGKTTLAEIVANMLDVPFFTLSAVTSGVKDVRDVIEKAKLWQRPCFPFIAGGQCVCPAVTDALTCMSSATSALPQPCDVWKRH